MTAQLEQIRFQMEEVRREYDEGRARREELVRQDRRRFIIQTIVTSIAGVVAAAALILHLIGRT